MLRLIHTIFFLGAVSALWAQDFFSTQRIPVVKITFENTNWEARLDSLKQHDGKGRMLAKVSIDGVDYDSVGVRYKGNSSYFNVRSNHQAKLPFNLKSNEVRKSQLFPDGMDVLKLANGFRDPSCLREILAYDIAGQYMPASKANFVHLYVNDKDYGLYTNTQAVDDDFLAKFYGGFNRGTLYKCDPNWDAKDAKGCTPGDKASLIYLGEDSTCYAPYYEPEQGRDWKSLIALTRAFQKEPQKISEYLDIDRTLWMLAFNTVTVNLDSYHGRLCHNYYLYRDSSGRYTPIIWDLNLCFGGFAYDGINPAPLSAEQMANISPFLHYDNPKRPLINVVLKNPTYRKVYLAHMRTILEEHFYNHKYAKRLQELAKYADAGIKTDPIKLYSYEAYKQNIDQPVDIGKTSIAGITSLMDKRTEFLRNHPLLKKVPPTIETPQTSVSGEQVTITVKAGGAEKAWCCTRTTAAEAAKWLPMTGTATPGTFNITIPKKDVKQYFVVAEAEEAAACSPARTGMDWHQVH